MAEVAKILYIAVVDEEEKRDNGKESFRYTRSVLQTTLQLIGCKARHAFKARSSSSSSSIFRYLDLHGTCSGNVPNFTVQRLNCYISQRVFELIRSERSTDPLLPEGKEKSDSNDSTRQLEREDVLLTGSCLAETEAGKRIVSASGKDNSSKSVPFELYKRRTTVIVMRQTFLNVVCDALAEYKYVGRNQRADLILACRIREKKESVTVLLCGASGCGKSTLSALLGSRLGITTVVSTDSIRHMMRSFVDEKQNPLLWASTYHAGDYLDPVAVAEARAKKKAKKLAGMSHSLAKEDVADGSANGVSDAQKQEAGSGTAELISPKQMAIEGFKAQSEMVIDSLDRLITAWEERKESVVVEGVHLSLNFVLIQRQGSSRHLMTLLNNDGSVAKAWPIESVDGNGKPLLVSGEPIGKAEQVNLPFGLYGITAWPSDGGTSRAGSVDESRADGTETGSRYYSSCCSSPRMSDGPSKELKEENSVHGSDEEVDDQLEPGSDEDFSDDGDKHDPEEVGSVDEESTKSDEEYDDLAMQDMMDNGYWSEDDEEAKDKMAAPVSGDQTFRRQRDKFRRNTDNFLRSKSDPLSDPLCPYSSLLKEKNETRMPSPAKNRRRSLSIPALGKHGPVISEAILSGAPRESGLA
ncbi:hypothetical protein TIFTF001_000737 [Ficus carica]|uniref:P-loop containing nucleoside triphosphate hydrolases superfamily protein n=1 Tax=Ficus carica TaxID=3494 RepID=A0AA87ZIE6_FICCA|nr:hypothetical protein TIFTF001_000737 [Ficus carica]